MDDNECETSSNHVNSSGTSVRTYTLVGETPLGDHLLKRVRISAHDQAEAAYAELEKRRKSKLKQNIVSLKPRTERQRQNVRNSEKYRLRMKIYTELLENAVSERDHEIHNLYQAHNTQSKKLKIDRCRITTMETDKNLQMHPYVSRPEKPQGTAALTWAKNVPTSQTLTSEDTQDSVKTVKLDMNPHSSPGPAGKNQAASCFSDLDVIEDVGGVDLFDDITGLDMFYEIMGLDVTGSDLHLPFRI